MRHELLIEGPGLRLRPITDTDAAFVLQLRSDPALSRYLHPVSGRLEDQLDWFAAYDQRQGDYYFVVERRDTGAAEGVVAIYDVVRGPSHSEAEWGRWILRPGSLAAVESAWLAYRCAFELLDLDSVFCRTVAENGRVVSFHDSCGIERKRLLPAHFNLGGQVFDAVEHRVERDVDWPSLSAKLERLALMTAKRSQRHA